MFTDNLLFVYFIVLFAGVCVVAMAHEFRRKRFEPTLTEDNIFRCGQCRYVYTDDRDVDRSRCPQCGQFNELFVF